MPRDQNPNLPHHYTANADKDDLDMSGVEYPAGIDSFDRIEAQNEGLTLSLFGF